MCDDGPYEAIPLSANSRTSDCYRKRSSQSRIAVEEKGSRMKVLCVRGYPSLAIASQHCRFCRQPKLRRRATRYLRLSHVSNPVRIDSGTLNRFDADVNDNTALAQSRDPIARHPRCRVLQVAVSSILVINTSLNSDDDSPDLCSLHGRIASVGSHMHRTSNASQQGGVRPKCEQGSSVTYTVEFASSLIPVTCQPPSSPRSTIAPAFRSAKISACGLLGIFLGKNIISGTAFPDSPAAG